MTAQTIAIIRGACAMDATVDPAKVEPALLMLMGREMTDEPLSAREAAAMMKCTPRTVKRYADKGVLRRIGLHGKGTQTRYSRASVEAFLNGMAA